MIPGSRYPNGLLKKIWRGYKMAYIHEIELSEVISELPEVSRIEMGRDFSNQKDAMFICALGFEDRCPLIPRRIAENTTYKCDEAIYFEYSTNREDNEINREELVESLEDFATLVTPMQCDSEEFSDTLRQMFRRLCNKETHPSITLDISVCASKSQLIVLKIIFEFDIKLRIVYSEADIYHPTSEEIEKNLDKWIREEKSGLTRGVGSVFTSREHPGYNPDAQPEAIIAFATFKPERTRSIISFIDETLREKPEDRVVWIIGVPHLKEDYWRIDILRDINEIPEDLPSFNVSTFDYKDTLKTLDKIYKKYSYEYHFNISPLGSKMQSLGINLFHYIRPDVTIVFAPPKEYYANRYSEGCKGIWIIDFGNLSEIRDTLNRVGLIEIRNGKYTEDL